MFENAPPEIDQYISPTDSELFAECLTNLEVERFEVDQNPRSFLIRMTFDTSKNKHFSDEVLEKRFWFRRSADGWSGLVSEPVGINWKKGNDITNGLTTKALKLFSAQRTASTASSANGKSKKAPPKVKEYDDLLKALETSTEGELSFFTWFGFISSHRYVSAEENAAAIQKQEEDRAKRAAGEDVPEEEDDEFDPDAADENLEIFPNGDELATLIAEDLWPQALKYFISVQEMDDEDMEEVDEEEEDEEESDGEGEVDIRALVQGKGKKNGKEGSPPTKKRKA